MSDRKSFASGHGGALRAHRRHQVSPHVSDRNGGKQMTEVGPALLEPLAPASQPCTALVMKPCSLTTTFHAEQLGGIRLGAWGLLAAAAAQKCASRRSEKREAPLAPCLVYVVNECCLPRAPVR